MGLRSVLLVLVPAALAGVYFPANAKRGVYFPPGATLALSSPKRSLKGALAVEVKAVEVRAEDKRAGVFFPSSKSVLSPRMRSTATYLAFPAHAAGMRPPLLSQGLPPILLHYCGRSRGGA